MTESNQLRLFPKEPKHCTHCVDYLKERIKNSVDPCPVCGRPLDVMAREGFLSNSLIVRHICRICSLIFNPDGSTTRFISDMEARATIEMLEIEQKIIKQESESVLHEAESIVHKERNIND